MGERCGMMGQSKGTTWSDEMKGKCFRSTVIGKIIEKSSSMSAWRNRGVFGGGGAMRGSPTMRGRAGERIGVDRWMGGAQMSLLHRYPKNHRKSWHRIVPEKRGKFWGMDTT
jgi:hypothetical protein